MQKQLIEDKPRNCVLFKDVDIPIGKENVIHS